MTPQSLPRQPEGPPEDIPQDVHDAAWKAAGEWFRAIGTEEYHFADAIARAIMAERERCAGIIDAANAHYAEQHELAKNTRPNREVRDLQTMRIATAGLSALIRGGQS